MIKILHLGSRYKIIRNRLRHTSPDPSIDASLLHVPRRHLLVVTDEGFPVRLRHYEGCGLELRLVVVADVCHWGQGRLRDWMDQVRYLHVVEETINWRGPEHLLRRNVVHGSSGVHAHLHAPEFLPVTVAEVKIVVFPHVAVVLVGLLDDVYPFGK